MRAATRPGFLRILMTAAMVAGLVETAQAASTPFYVAWRQQLAHFDTFLWNEVGGLTSNAAAVVRSSAIELHRLDTGALLGTIPGPRLREESCAVTPSLVLTRTKDQGLTAYDPQTLRARWQVPLSAPGTSWMLRAIEHGNEPLVTHVVRPAAVIETAWPETDYPKNASTSMAAARSRRRTRAPVVACGRTGRRLPKGCASISPSSSRASV